MKCKNLLPGLRQLMAQHNLTAYYIPSPDPHNSEYTPACYKRVAAVSGFTGSAGTAIVTKEKALLWTDGRYFSQAGTELSSDWELVKMGVPGHPTVGKWCAGLEDGSRFGFHPYVMTVAQHEQLSKAAGKIKLVAVDENLLDRVWDTRPAHPASEIFSLPIEFSGRAAQDKVKSVVESLEKLNAQSVVISALDEIAWLFNLRADDIECTPVFFSYAVVTHKGDAHLFTDLSRFPAAARAEVKPFTTFHEYSSVVEKLPEICSGKVLYDPRTTSMAVFGVLEGVCNPAQEQSCVAVMKAVKNETEMKGFENCHVRDGAALAQYLMWLEGEVAAGRTVTECTGADKLEWFRSQQAHYVSLSFASISASGGNGAIIHYKPQPDTCRVIAKEDLYLIDSGGQYKDGTTDVTRTICFGNPRPKEVEAFTLVLKGVINISTMVFPAETLGQRIDAAARQALWRYGLDYMHGTGHGVGHFLGVHEGPIGIGTRATPTAKPLAEGNVVSNEPGYYEEGAMGIRIENLEKIKKADTKYQFNDVQYLTMEPLTVCPIDTRLVDPSLLSSDEIQWLDDYHKRVEAALTAATTDPAFHKWLVEKCAPIGDGRTAKRRKL